MSSINRLFETAVLLIPTEPYWHVSRHDRLSRKRLSTVHFTIYPRLRMASELMIQPIRLMLYRLPQEPARQVTSTSGLNEATVPPRLILETGSRWSSSPTRPRATEIRDLPAAKEVSSSDDQRFPRRHPEPKFAPHFRNRHRRRESSSRSGSR